MADKFPLSSEQCELLLAFEDAPTAAALARVMGRDQSVVHRQLQRLAEASPVLEKAEGRWRLTGLGRQLNGWTRAAILAQRRLLAAPTAGPGAGDLPALDGRTVLLVVNAQQGVAAETMGPRNNPQAEANLGRLLASWRAAGFPVAYAQHVSPGVGAALAAGTLGGSFKPGLAPLAGETVAKKTANSAFVGTPLAALFQERGYTAVVVAGFATNYCVDASARSAADLGFRCFVVADATAAFDLAWDGDGVIRAQQVHDFTLATLRGEYASILDTQTLVVLLAGRAGGAPDNL